MTQEKINEMNRHVMMSLGAFEAIVETYGNESFITDISKRASRQLDKIKIFFKSSAIDISKLLTKDIDLRLQKSLASRSLHLQLITNETFGKIIDEKTPTIMGASTTLNNVSLTIYEELERFKSVYRKDLDSVDTSVSSFLSDEGYRTSFAKSNLANKMMTHIEESKTNLKSVIDPNDGNDVKTFNEVYGNANGLKETLLQIVKNNTSLNKKEIKSLVKDITKINDKIITLINLIENKDMRVTQASLITLKTMIQTAAEYVTLLTTIFYINIRLNEVVDTAWEIHKKKN